MPIDPATSSAELKEDLIAQIPKLRAFAMSLCGNPDRADDLVQETFIKAWGHLGSFVEGSNLVAWLFTILRNVYFTQHRKRRREVPDIDGAYSDRLSVAPGQNAHMDMLDFRAALARLSAEQRAALVLICAAGHTYDEAAQICDCAVGTVKSRVSRARAELAAMLSVRSGADFYQAADWAAPMDATARSASP